MSLSKSHTVCVRMLMRPATDLLKNKSNPEAAAGEVAAWGLGSLASVNYVGGSHGRGDA